MRINRFLGLNYAASTLALVGAASAAAMMPVAAQAQAAAEQNFSIAAGDLATALQQYSAQTGVQLVYSSELVAGKQSPGVSGRMTRADALAALLGGTGLTAQLSGNSATILKVADAVAPGDGERVLGAVRVEGAQTVGSALAGATPVNGINGSRDVTATEGTGSYTSNALTIGSKTAATIKDTPMSVSVLTSQQMQDQNITDLNGAMRNLPGVSLVAGGNGQYDFYARGFQITQFQFDGGAAMNVLASNNGYSRPLIDMSLYDHVEIVRGAAGTFNGYGNPGGVVNLVRKKPLDHVQLLTELQVGSWDLYRGMVDLTGPLAFDGKLRGRVIATHQDNHYFYDIAKSSRNILSATLEFDATPTTLVSVGANYQESDDLPFSKGLMRYQDGRSLGLPRSTCFCFTWTSDKTQNTEFFGQVEQRIGSDWTAKFKATRIKQKEDSILPYVWRSVIPATLQGAELAAGRYRYGRSRQTMFEGTIEGRFRLFGQDQKMIAGANYSMLDLGGTKAGFDYNVDSAGNPVAPTFPGQTNNSVDVFSFNPSDWKAPTFAAGYQFDFKNFDYRTLNAYINLDLTPIKRLHFATGIRYAGYRYQFLRAAACTPSNVQRKQFGCTAFGQIVYTGAGTLNKGSAISWPPSVQARYDLTDNLTASAIYTDIYIDQSTNVDRNDKSIPPITGGNFEGMLKWLSPDKKLNITLSGYYIRQNGFAASDPICTTSANNPVPDSRCTTSNSTTTAGQLNQQANCCYVFNADQKNISYGAELELAGELSRGWQMSASYSFNRSYQNYSTTFDGQRTSLVSQAPRHKFQFWTTYEFSGRSRVAGLVLGLGAQAQSSTFIADGYCSAFVPDPYSTVPGALTCDYYNGAFKDVYFTEPGRIVFSGSVGYKLNSRFRIDAQIENLLDKTYYETVGGINYGNYYGAPRNVKLTLRGKF